MRGSNQGHRASSGGYNNSGSAGSAQPSYNQGGYRGGRGGYNSHHRGGMQVQPGGYNRVGYQQPVPQPMPGSYQSGYQSPMGGMPTYGGGYQGRNNVMTSMRGNSMGMRGGRGGMANPMMVMPMGGMPMGGMPGPMGPMGMGMPQIQLNSAMGLQGKPV